MIKITNGQMTLTVPNSTYSTIYKALGFCPLEDEEVVSASADTFPALDEKKPEEDVSIKETEDTEEPAAKVEDEIEEVDLSEIPLSEMDFFQLESYADQLGINHRGIRSKKELRALIRNNI